MPSLARKKAAEETPKQERTPMLTKLKAWAQKEKPEKRRAYRPRGYAVRKIGVGMFWLAFAFMFLVVFFSAIQPSDPTSAESQLQMKLNPATTTTAVQYAENFAREFFTWGPDDKAKQERQARLKPFLAKGLDEQAGLHMMSLKTTSTFLKSEIKHIEEMGSNRAYVTLKVFHEVGVPKEVEKNATVAETSVEGETPSKSPATKTVEYEKQEASKFFVVPVGYDADYGIYDLPKFTYLENQTTMVAQNSARGLRTIDGAEEKRNIRNFLDTFFSSYATDPRDKLGYLLTDPDHQSGLNGSLHFVSVTNAEVYEGEGWQTAADLEAATEQDATNEAAQEEEASAAPVVKDYIVLAAVVMEDPVSLERFTSNYRLSVVEKEGRYVVSQIDEN